jgi:hypothetical protein
LGVVFFRRNPRDPKEKRAARGFVIKSNCMEPQKTGRGAKIAWGCGGAFLVGAVLCVVGLVYFHMT